MVVLDICKRLQEVFPESVISNLNRISVHRGGARIILQFYMRNGNLGCLLSEWELEPEPHNTSRSVLEVLNDYSCFVYIESLPKIQRINLLPLLRDEALTDLTVDFPYSDISPNVSVFTDMANRVDAGDFEICYIDMYTSTASIAMRYRRRDIVVLRLLGDSSRKVTLAKFNMPRELCEVMVDDTPFSTYIVATILKFCEENELTLYSDVDPVEMSIFYEVLGFGPNFSLPNSCAIRFPILDVGRLIDAFNSICNNLQGLQEVWS